MDINNPGAPDSKNPEAVSWFEKGNEYYHQGNYHQAIDCYNKAVEIDQKDAEAWGNMGAAYGKLGEHQRAIDCFNKAVEIDPNLAKAWGNMGLAYYQLGDHQRAIDCFKKAVEIDQKDAEAWGNMGAAYGKLGEHQRAIDCFKKAVEIDPNLAKAWGNMGAAYGKLGDHQRAIDCFKKAVEIDQKDAEAWFNMGLAYYQLGDHQRAIDCFKKAVEINPNLAEAWGNMGAAYGKLGDHQRAIDCFNKAVEIDQNLAEAWGNMGAAYAELGEHQRAIDCFNKAVEIDPNLAEAWGNMGVAYAKLGDHQRAIDCFKKAVEIDPNLAKAWGNMGNAYYELGEHHQAIDCYKRAVAIDPNLAEAWYLMGWIYSLQHQTSEAKGCFEKVFEIVASYQNISNINQFYEFNKTVNNLRKIMFYTQDYDRLLWLELIVQDVYDAIIKAGKVKFPLVHLIYNFLYLGKNKKLGRQEREEWLKKAYNLADPLREYHLLAEVWFERGRIREEAKNISEAASCYERAIQYCEKFRGSLPGVTARALFMTPFWQYYKKTADIALANRDYTKAFNYREQMAARTLKEYLANTADTILASRVEEGIVERVNKIFQEWEDTRRKLEDGCRTGSSLAGYAEKIAEIETRWAELVKELSEKYPEITPIFSVAAPDYQSIAGRLKKNEVIIEYYYQGEEYKKENEKEERIDKIHIWITKPGTKEPIYRCVDLRQNPLIINETLLRNIEGEYDIKVWQNSSKKIYDALIKPIAGEIGLDNKVSLRRKVIYIVPYRALHLLPFHALWNGRKYFGEMCLVSQLPSAATLTFFQPKNKQPEFFWGAAKENYQDAFGHNDLPGVEEHCWEMANLFPSRDGLIGNVTREDFLKRLQECQALREKNSYLAVFLHGRVSKELALCNFIVSQGVPVSCKDLMSLGRLNLDTAYLVSCESGRIISLGDAGDEQSGFVHSLMVLGSPSIIAPITKIEVEPALKLHEHFLNLYINKKLDKGTAFAQAQKRIRNNQNYNWTAKTWAPYILYGIVS